MQSHLAIAHEKAHRTSSKLISGIRSIFGFTISIKKFHVDFITQTQSYNLTLVLAKIAMHICADSHKLYVSFWYNIVYKLK